MKWILIVLCVIFLSSCGVSTDIKLENSTTAANEIVIAYDEEEINGNPLVVITLDTFSNELFINRLNKYGYIKTKYSIGYYKKLK